jgi:CBS domain-containing protein
MTLDPGTERYLDWLDLRSKEAGLMKISSLLARKGSTVSTIGGDATVGEAVSQLKAERIGALVVSADGEHIDGILSERDVVRALAEEGAELLGRPVASIMTEKVFSCDPDDDIESLMSVMTERRIRHVPVVESDLLRGIVSIGDVVKNRIDELEKDRRELVDYITAR